MSNEIERKVLVLLGSPREKGNSSILAGKIADGAEAAGATVETLYIHGLDIKACQGCWACQKEGSKGCVIRDEMQTVYAKLAEAYAWVIASPIHWFNVSTQTKLWLDRAFALAAYGGSDVFQKKIALAFTYADHDTFTSGCINAIRSFQDAASYTGAEIVGTLHGCALEPGEIAKNAELLEKAESLGRSLVD